MRDDRDPDGGFADGEPGENAPADADASVPAGWRSVPAAVYGLEQPVRCPACAEEIDQVFVVRLFRARANFMSSLPRSGRLLACPRCRTILPGELGAVF